MSSFDLNHYRRLDLARGQELLDRKYVDLASANLGASILEFSDEFFAEASNLLKHGRPVRDPNRFTEHGAWYDGWETRRHNHSYDWVVIKLGFTGHITGFDIDTTYFNGNHAPIADVEACYSPDRDPIHEILSKIDLGPSAQHFIEIPKTPRFTHVRLNIYPDGGVSRFRVYGIVSPNWPSDHAALLDLAFVGHGAKPVACSDQHFSKVENLLLPGRGVDMSDGWETKRSRQENHKDWVIVRLGSAGYLEQAEIDTAFYKGNYPESASLEACYSDSVIPDASIEWTQILEKSKLSPHRQHLFQLSVVDQKFSHVRMTIYPDGGVKRLRIIGRKNLPSPNHKSRRPSSPQIPAVPALPPPKHIVAQPLTYEHYAPYGHIIQSFPEPKRTSPLATTITNNIRVTPANQGTARKYNHIAPVVNACQKPILIKGDSDGNVQFVSKAEPNLSLYRCLPVSKLPFDVRLLERHPYSSQAFVPMCGGTNVRAYMIVVCLSDQDGIPDFKTLKSFLCSSSQGISYNPGVWHHPMIALEETTDFVCLTHESGVATQDCEEIEVGSHNIQINVIPEFSNKNE
ncbi:15367_t:CDS:2 [Acaulospora morrowiae]|uniref:15367_t:CDS:1 n=1 Tax=Acaulospora morrowiae TaxID=94023 RepID=A0A9N8ZR89_9GLOM|nr:15367_t:CDS:2 [Acaulospora morrowiae]